MQGVIAAIRNETDFETALRSNATAVFLLRSHILTLDAMAERAREAGKPLFVHVDMAEGIGKDKAGMQYLAKRKVGIISTKNNLILRARELGLDAVQRFFIIDSQSIASAVEAIRSAHPTAAEFMPGLQGVVERLKGCGVPVIAGGLISDIKSAQAAFAAGAEAVSTSEKSLWSLTK